MRTLPDFRLQRGSALLIVLWVIALLSFCIITALTVAMQDIETVGARKAVFRARQLAEMGVTVASHPLVKPGDPILRRRLSPHESYEAIITSEESRLNLNALLTEERLPVLERIFKVWGLSEPEAETLVDHLMDWTDPDSFRRMKGAEVDFYKNAGVSGRPFNRPFQTLEEAGLVAGMEMLAEFRPDWREWFTLRGSGRLDVNEASAEMLSLATGAPIHEVRAIVEHRDGPDGIPHTDDDARFQNVEEVATLLGGGTDPQALASLLAVDSTTLRIQSTGRAGDCSRSMAVVLRKSRGQNPVLEWREFVGE